MVDPEDVLEGARCIRPFLADLIEHEAGDVDDQLAKLLVTKDQPRRKTSERVLKVLRDRDATDKWIKQFLEIKAAQKSQSIQLHELFSPLPGDPRGVPAARFECPNGDYVWYRPSVGTPVPHCPTHGTVLIRKA